MRDIYLSKYEDINIDTKRNYFINNKIATSKYNM